MTYSISVIINLKNNNNISNTDSLLKEIGVNCNTINIYEDYELNGINKYIKSNSKIIILEFDFLRDIENFLEIIIGFNDLKIEYIYHDNSIIYASTKFLNNLKKSIHSKIKIENILNENKSKITYKNIYKTLKI
tara:strand:- start:1178 stop:1579 length:402 start_codon:yes stop_codon:yes gene_type:complete